MLEARTIFSLIEEFASMAYEIAEEDRKKGKVYNTRSMAASLALSKSVPVKDIMSTAGWSSEDTPRRHYLHQIENQIDVPKFVMAQSVI